MNRVLPKSALFFFCVINDQWRTIVSNVKPFLRGKPVLVMRTGHYPNKADIRSVTESYPGHIVRTEPVFNPCRFAVTVQRRAS